MLGLHLRPAAARERAHVLHLRLVAVMLEHDLAATVGTDEVLAVAHQLVALHRLLVHVVHLGAVGLRHSPTRPAAPAPTRLPVALQPGVVGSDVAVTTSLHPPAPRPPPIPCALSPGTTSRRRPCP